MSNLMTLSGNGAMQLPAHLQGQNLGLTESILATMGATGNRIGLKGSRFRIILNGKEESVREENHLDCIIVGVVPHISRMYYEGKFDPNTKAKPTCFSEDGNAPPADLPTKQAPKCDGCKWNEKGSRVVEGQKMKACGFFQRLVVMLPGDPNHYYKLDVKSQGIFGESKPDINKFNIRDYGKLLANRGVDAASVVSRISFDTDSSVPKLLFSAASFVTAEDFEGVKLAVGSDEVKNMLQISMGTVDLTGETDDAEDTVDTTQTAGVQAAPVEKPVTQTAKPTAAPAPTAEPVKKQYRGVPEKLGEFTVQGYLDSGWTKEQLIAEGMIVEVVPDPPKPAAPPKPPAAPKPPAPPAQGKPVVEDVPAPGQAAQTAPAAPKPAPAPAAPAAPKPGTVQEVTTDAELQALIGELM